MPFDKLAHVFLRSGEETGVWVANGSSVDLKAQWIMADPDLPGEYFVGTYELEVYGFRKRLEHPDFGLLWYSYRCVVKNLGRDTWFSLQGGGNT